MEKEKDTRVKDILKLCSQKNGEIPIIKKMKGFLLDNRFLIQGKLNEGAFGQIYSGVDTQTMFHGSQKPIIIKFTQNHPMNDAEFRALADIQK